tara:strand:+ start:22340 stop:23296 length:957 start_codon:yes stop_codon:yes gene_type:complete
MKKSYFDNENRLMPHGIMFHHFHHENERPYAQGSITSPEFEKIINYIGLENILPAKIWFEKAMNNTLSKKQVCLTFDDSLKCQIDIAYPILKKLKIGAFWFVFSSVFKGEASQLEVYRYFYNMYFPNFNAFYLVFKKYFIQSEIGYLYDENYDLFIKSKYLVEFEFYHEEEREFRFFRDRVLNRKDFENIMDKIIIDYEVDVSSISKNLWMDNKDLTTLNSNDQVIGLHSYNHPTNMGQLEVERQQKEYRDNKEHILSVIDKAPLTVSHPCGSYNKSTLKVLDKLGVKIGFRSNFQKLNHNTMEFPRVDHSNIIREIN